VENGFVDHPGRIRSERIPPPDPPGQALTDILRTALGAIPRVVRAWVVGARLTPIDGSPSWETTDIVLVLDPPITRESLGAEIELLQEELEAVGWRQEPHRNWVYADTRFRPAERGATLIYSRPTV